MRLSGKVALVTGAGRGIGRAIAVALAAEGAAVTVNDLHAGSAQETAALILEAQGRAIVAAADIADLSTHASLISTGVDILVNNAGIEFREPFLESRPETWDQTFAINLKAPFFLAQAAARRMISARTAGTILNIASVHDSVALRDRSIYAITKGGVRMMTRALAFELAAHGITVNAISPGAILTGMNRDALADPAYRQSVLNKIPLGRIGSVNDIAGAAVFLVSPEAAYITGATLYVDGGMLVQ